MNKASRRFGLLEVSGVLLLGIAGTVTAQYGGSGGPVASSSTSPARSSPYTVTKPAVRPRMVVACNGDGDDVDRHDASARSQGRSDCVGHVVTTESSTEPGATRERAAVRPRHVGSPVEKWGDDDR